MPQNFTEIFDGLEGRCWALVAPGGSLEEGTSLQGAPGGPGVPWRVVPTSDAPGPPLCSINTPKIPEP